MQPVRKVLTATHFKWLPDVKKWTPCSPGDPDAQEKSWTDIESDELQEPPLRVADFLKSLDNVRPTVTAEDLKKHDQWTLESGKPGNTAFLSPPLYLRHRLMCFCRFDTRNVHILEASISGFFFFFFCFSNIHVRGF